jgi:hypothetical protein
MARRSKTTILKRQRERKKMEKAAIKREERERRKQEESDGSQVASQDDLAAYGLVDPDAEEADTD